MAGDVKFPEIEVELSGKDGNAFGVLAEVRKALRRGGVSAEQIEEFESEATSGDYDHLLQTAMAWVVVS